jgi:hypothetical protein
MPGSRDHGVEHLDAWRAVADAPEVGVTVRSDDVMMYVISDVRAPFSWGPERRTTRSKP